MDAGSPSTARYVEWRPASAPVERPIVRVVDVPGGRLDLLVNDPDVTTFFNDRFHPLFRTPGVVDGEPLAIVATVQFFTPDGCPTSPPIRVWSTQELIDVGNSVMLTTPQGSGHAGSLTLQCPVPTR